MRDEAVACELERRLGLNSAHRGEVDQKLRKRMTCFEVIEAALYRDTRADEYGCPFSGRRLALAAPATGNS